MIEAVDLMKRYGDYEAVKGVSFTVGTGRIVGLLGPNGAGKTTVMRILTGYHWPSAGSATLDGFDIVENPFEVKRRVGYLPENAPLYPDLTVSEFLSFAASSRGLEGASGKEAVGKSVEACGLATVFHVPIEKLSKGFRQRVGLAQAILHDPDILILDEPTSGLDPNQILEIRALIRALGEKKTVILCTHILQEAEALCADVLIMNEGRIVAAGATGTIGDALKGEERFELTLKADAGRVRSAFSSLRAVRPTGDIENAGPGAVRIRLAAPLSLAAKDGYQGGPAEDVFDWAVSGGFKILEMRRECLSLEEIFVKLTTEEKQP
ncbi:MAG: ATP-binding cassette domain-containing protein [Spirochaetes bacterium]|nr:ATP-binding cassette domain-containing protein [Spirochaetota bacterium]